jgi:hypothetical protein
MKPYFTLQPWRKLHPHPGVNQAPMKIQRYRWADDRDLNVRDRERLYEFVGETEFQRWKERIAENEQIKKDSKHGHMIHFDRSVIQRYLFYRVHAPSDGSGWRHFVREMNRMYE